MPKTKKAKTYGPSQEGFTNPNEFVLTAIKCEQLIEKAPNNSIIIYPPKDSDPEKYCGLVPYKILSPNVLVKLGMYLNSLKRK